MQYTFPLFRGAYRGGWQALCATALALFFSFISSAHAAESPTAWRGLRTDGPRIVDANGKNFVMKGFGAGEWANVEAYMIEWPDGDGKYLWYYGHSRIQETMAGMMSPAAYDQYWQQWNANIMNEDDFARMQRWGVNTLRISINHHWLSPADGVYLDSGWAWLDQTIAWAKAHNIYVVLCMHAAPGAQSNELMSDTVDGTPHLWTEPEIYQPWTIRLWQAIAQRYVNDTTVAGYELLDEPIVNKKKPRSGGKTLRKFYVELTDAIRTIDRNHIIFACGTEWCGTPAAMRTILPPWDDNMAFVFHKYWDKNNQDSIQGYLDIRDKYKVPMWNAETGENTNAWAQGMVDLLDRHNIGWAWWTYKKVNNDAQPCNVREPANYDKVLDYVGGKGPKPSQATADRIMLELAGNTATSKCEWNDDLLQILFNTDH